MRDEERFGCVKDMTKTESETFYDLSIRLKIMQDNYARLQERYDQLEGWHEVLREENSEFERKIEILKKALELACKALYPEPFYKYKKEYSNEFIKQAKKEINGNDK